jgi:hypothetical protein
MKVVFWAGFGMRMRDGMTNASKPMTIIRGSYAVLICHLVLRHCASPLIERDPRESQRQLLTSDERLSLPIYFNMGAEVKGPS